MTTPTVAYIRTAHPGSILSVDTSKIGSQFTDVTTLIAQACGGASVRIAVGITGDVAVEAEPMVCLNMEGIHAAMLQGYATAEIVEVKSGPIYIAMTERIRLHFGRIDNQRIYLLKVQDDLFLLEGGKLLTIRHTDL